MGQRHGRADQSPYYRANAAPHATVTQKKTIVASERDPWERAAFALQQATWDANDLVVVDEFGSNLDLARTHAWAPRGKRAVSALPRNTPHTTTTIAALTPDGMGPAMVLVGGVDQTAFAASLEHVLVPTLRPGQIVVADNLSAHKSAHAHAIVAARGCTLRFLPTYSPDYSPIELAIAQMKAQLRHVAARTTDTLQAAIGAALDQITAVEARAFFRHCGYRFPPAVDQWFCT